MPDIDKLTVKFSSSGVTRVIKNINNLASAVEGLASKTKNLDTDKLTSFADGLKRIKESAPTKTNVNNITSLVSAINSLNGAISGSGNISGFAQNMSDLSSSLNNIKGSSAGAIKKASAAIENLNQEAKETAASVAKVAESSMISTANEKPVFKGISNEDFSKNIQLQTFKGMTSEISKATIGATRLGKALSNILVPTGKMKSLQNEVEKTRQKYNELREAMIRALSSGNMEMGDKNYQKQAIQLEGLRQKYNDLILKQKELAVEGEGFKINPSITNVLKSFSQGFTKAGNVIKNIFVKALKSANTHLKSLAKNMFKTLTASNATKKMGDNLTGLAKKLSNELLRVSKMLKLMVTRMALRKVIEEVGNGFQSLALHSSAFNQSVSDVINASKQLGYSFSAMVSPLINALAPAIVYLINLLTKLANIINQVFSALTGASTWNKAKKFNDSWADSIAGAGSSASKAAKEIKKTVLGFDELNQLQDNNSSSGGGGGGGIADMFDTVDIDPKWKSFADWLKSMWDMKDFTGLGKYLGEQLRDALESIPWDKIRQTSNDLGKCLATLINGFVEVERLGYDIGYTVAQSVNTVFEFVNGFVHNLHWDSIGKFIADTFNGFFETIDWELIKDTCVTGMAGIAEAIQNFIDTFHWDNLSTFISNAINTIVESIYTFVDGIDWGDLGTKLGDQLMKTINKIDFNKIGQTIGKILQNAIKFVRNFVSQINIDDVRKKIKDLIDGFFDEVDPNELGKMLGEIIHKAIELAKGIWKDNKATIKQAGWELIKGLFSEIKASDIVAIVAPIVLVGLIGGVTSAIPSIIKEVGKQAIGRLIVNAMFGGSAGGAAGAAAGGEVAAAATSGGLAIGTGVIGGIAAGLALSEPVKDGIFELSKLLGANEEQVDNVKSAYNGLSGTWNIVKEGAQELWYKLTGNQEALDKLNDKVIEIKDEFGNTEKVVDRFGNTLIEVNTSGIADMSKKLDDGKAKMEVYATKADVAADKIIDIKVATDEAGAVTSTYSETILPKLGDEAYKAESAQESLSKALEDYRNKIEDAKNHQTIYKTTLDVIKEAQEKNVKVVDDNTTSYQRYKSATGEVVIAINDLSPAYDTVRDAAKDASEKTADYMNASDDVIQLIPDLNSNLETVSETMGDVSQSVSDSAEEMRDQFSEDKWKLEGLQNALPAAFQLAIEAAKKKLSDFFSWTNDKLNFKINGGETVNIGRVGYATGGFPEDGLFFANHNELVGEFSNGKTAVANNAQIVAGIEQGVYEAVTRANAQNAGTSKYISNEIIVDGEVIARSVSKGLDSYNRRYNPQTT